MLAARIVMTLAAMGVTATVVAIALAVYDMARSGHGKSSFVYASIDFPGSQMSWGDAALLAAALVAGLAAWIASGRT